MNGRSALKSALIAKTQGKANDNQIVTANGCRVTVLTTRLIRVEFGDQAAFTDEATQSIWFRAKDVAFSSEQTQSSLLIKTADAVFIVDISKKSVTVTIDGKTVKASNKGNLLGTRRTLDFTSGPVKIGKGLISKTGVAVLDDSASLLVLENGEIAARVAPEKDIYIFAYGTNYRTAIKDFYGIAGAVPLIPRYALGVWWSRYRAYSQQAYTELMQRFIDEEIPLSVATIDMDWHWVDLKKQFPDRKYSMGKNGLLIWTAGWTGYSWNTDLFPDYKGFLAWLKSKDLRITLNVHPASGLRDFEDMYEQMAIACGVDPATKQAVDFSPSDPLFLNNYFDIMHKPYEKEGVDFWWLDWQQGTAGNVPGLDPLWALNHYHFLDNAESGQLPLILSRFAGAGSHRYPLGFSGDTSINWRGLNFQPYFTANAANVGYTWWSHDIGGHHFGRRDAELYTRWLQFGALSPVMRLHSTSNDLLGKEPWRYDGETASIAKDWLIFRHKLVPYIYTMDYRTHKDGLALVEPMYYSYPDKKEAYKVPNQYFFGSELIACPVTKKCAKSTRLAPVKVWLPEGRWTDVFTGEVYAGNIITTLYRDISSVPLLAKAGAIIPLSNEIKNGTANPSDMEILIYRGNGEFTLFEDDGSSDFESNKTLTALRVTEKDGAVAFSVSPATGNGITRKLKLSFKDLINVSRAVLTVNGKETEYLYDVDGLSKKTFSFELTAEPTDDITLTITEYDVVKPRTAHEMYEDLFSRYETNNIYKTFVYSRFRKHYSILSISEMVPAAMEKALDAAHAISMNNEKYFD